jgi:aminopeptidase N
MQTIARVHRTGFEDIYTRLSANPATGLSSKDQGARALRNTALTYLCLNEDDRYLDLALKQRREALNMTSELGALEALNRSKKGQRLAALQDFRAKWEKESLVMNKWLMIRAIAPGEKTLAEVKELLNDGAVFDKTNPNKIYSLLLGFAKFNLLGFHTVSGEGYRFLADQVLEIDARNPQVASRVISAFNQWKTFDSKRQALMKAELERIAKHPGLSNNVNEIVTRSLA